MASLPLPSPVADPHLIEQLTALVVRAAGAILALAPDALAPRQKADQSPVTAADEAAEAVILEGLARLLPGVPVVSEEAATRPSVLPSIFVLVDPLDGTREFIAGRPDFTVNVAVMVDASPAVGVVAGPLLSRVWRGVVGQRAERLVFVPGDEPKAVEATPIHTRRAAQGLSAALSRSHLDAATEAFLARLPIRERTKAGSSAKFCFVAEGNADVYPRLSPTSEWDIAAGHAVLAAAGGTVTTPGGGPIAYGGTGRRFLVPAFVAWGDETLARRYAA